MSKGTKILKGPDGIKIELDKSQVFPDDPGQGTPALVTLRKGCLEGVSTYSCASEQGELDCGRGGFITLTDDQIKWLEDQVNEVDSFLA